MNSLDTLQNLETSIIIQKELDKCNKKMKEYEIKNNIYSESLKVTYNYLNDLLTCENDEMNEMDKKIIMDDINTLMKYIS
jgi:hypothetical protein